MKLPTIRGEIGAFLRVYSPPAALEEEIRAALTFKNPDYENAQRFSPYEVTWMPKTVCLVDDMGDHIRIPRGFVPHKSLSPRAHKIWRLIAFTDLRNTFPVEFPRQHLTLNSDQLRVTELFSKAMLKRMRPFGTHTFVLPTSAGKTLCQSACAELTGQRTVVICKTNLIKKAWLDDLYKFYGMNEKDVGIIQRDKYRIGKHFTVASLATISRRKELWQEIFANFGCMIIDEFQICPANTVRELVEACPAKYILGMTATPSRRDGKEYVIRALLGEPLLSIQNKQEETQSSYPLADAEVVRTNFRFDDEDGKPISGEGLDLHKLTSAIAKDEKRNALIVEKVKRDYDAGHSVLIASPRVEHVEILTKLLRKAGIPDANFLTGGTNINKGYTDALLEAVMTRNCRCLVATEQAIKLGANLNPLDRLHCVRVPGNASDLEQLVGRIRRKHPGKTEAMLTIYQDVEVPYLLGKFKSVFIPVMRKLKVARWLNVFMC